MQMGFIGEGEDSGFDWNSALETGLETWAKIEQSKMSMETAKAQAQAQTSALALRYQYPGAFSGSSMVPGVLGNGITGFNSFGLPQGIPAQQDNTMLYLALAAAAVGVVMFARN